MTSRVDLHCHSTASQLSRLGVQRSLGLPECATPPQEVYELAKRRGMDFVTITDHDTIDGCLELADRPDCFVSEELTARFAGEPQAVHVLCYGITPGDHEWLQAHAGDVEACAAYLHENGIACALAHPFYDVAAPLDAAPPPPPRRALPGLGGPQRSRAPELNMPAVVYVETHGGTGIGGSDDHAGVDIGRTYTEVPAASTPEEFLAPPPRAATPRPAASRAAPPSGRTRRWRWPPARWRSTSADGEAVGTRAAPSRPGRGAEDRPAGGRPGRRARGRDSRRHRPRRRPRACSSPGCAAIGHRAARPRADRPPAVRGASPTPTSTAVPAASTTAACAARSTQGHEPSPAATAGGDGRRSSRRCCRRSPTRRRPSSSAPRRRSSRGRAGERPRVALIADGIEAMHGVTHTIEQIRERGVPGFEVEVVGTDPGVDRRLPAATALRGPFYEGMRLGVPGLPDLAETLAEGRYDLVHVTAPGPAGVAAPLLSRDLRARRCSPATTPSSPPTPACAAATAASRRSPGPPSAPSTRRPSRVLSPSPAADRSLLGLGVERGADRPLGARRRRRPLRSREGRARRLPGRAAGPLRRSADPREGRRPARRELPAGASRSSRACTCCWPAAAPRRASCAPGSASTRPSSAGSRARTWLAPTPAPTSSSSARAPTPTARWCSRPAPAACRSSRSPRAGRRR